MTFDYESWIGKAQERLELLYKQREAIDREIADLQRGIEGFTPLVKSMWAGPDAGITASVRKVFKRKDGKIWYPPQIRDELLAMGVKLTQKNPLATIHQILGRLVNGGEIRAYANNGRTGYLLAEKHPAAKH